MQFRVNFFSFHLSFRTSPVPSVFEDCPVYQPASQPAENEPLKVLLIIINYPALGFSFHRAAPPTAAAASALETRIALVGSTAGYGPSEQCRRKVKKNGVRLGSPLGARCLLEVLRHEEGKLEVSFDWGWFGHTHEVCASGNRRGPIIVILGRKDGGLHLTLGDIRSERDTRSCTM